MNKIEILIINVLLSSSTAFYDKNSNIFFNLFGLIKKAKKIATYLANELFNYFFIGIGNVLFTGINFAYTNCTSINPNLFVYIVTN